jgi:hypothetical protein
LRGMQTSDAFCECGIGGRRSARRTIAQKY